MGYCYTVTVKPVALLWKLCICVIWYTHHVNLSFCSTGEWTRATSLLSPLITELYFGLKPFILGWTNVQFLWAESSSCLCCGSDPGSISRMLTSKALCSPMSPVLNGFFSPLKPVPKSKGLGVSPQASLVPFSIWPWTTHSRGRSLRTCLVCKWWEDISWFPIPLKNGHPRRVLVMVVRSKPPRQCPHCSICASDWTRAFFRASFHWAGHQPQVSLFRCYLAFQAASLTGLELTK